MSVGTPFYHPSMMVPMFQYPPNVMYPNYMSSAFQGKNSCILMLFTASVLFCYTVPRMVMGYQRPQSPSPLVSHPHMLFLLRKHHVLFHQWTPPGVFFGADLHSPSDSLSGEYQIDKHTRYAGNYFKMEKFPYTTSLPDTYQN